MQRKNTRTIYHNVTNHNGQIQPEGFFVDPRWHKRSNTARNNIAWFQLGLKTMKTHTTWNNLEQPETIWIIENHQKQTETTKNNLKETETIELTCDAKTKKITPTAKHNPKKRQHNQMCLSKNDLKQHQTTKKQLKLKERHPIWSERQHLETDFATDNAKRTTWTTHSTCNKMKPHWNIQNDFFIKNNLRTRQQPENPNNLEEEQNNLKNVKQRIANYRQVKTSKTDFRFSWTNHSDLKRKHLETYVATMKARRTGQHDIPTFNLVNVDNLNTPKTS